LFQVIRQFLLERKSAGQTLLSMHDLRQATFDRFTDRAARQDELDTVVQLLQSRGLVYRLDPRPQMTWVLLKPELINQYGSSVIQAARNHPQGIGAIAERDVLTGNLTLTGFQRLSATEETLVLESTAELLIRHDLCFREMGYLVFPSQINMTRVPPSETPPRTEVAYRFSGSIETIYASLVVRLSYTNYFRREDQWRYAVEFSRDGHRLGFAMHQLEEGTDELEICFHPGISEFDRVTFIRFVTDHLRNKGIDIQEHIRLYCPKCSKEVTDREAIKARVTGGSLEIPCKYCATAILIPASIEELYRREPSLGEIQRGLRETVDKRTVVEVDQFRADKGRYSRADGRVIHILHISDLHIEDGETASVYRTQLETDLNREMNIRRLDYLVVSGDIGNRSTEEEYRAAFEMMDGLAKHFALDPTRIVVVPGNHDVNWDLSEQAYPFVSRRRLHSPLQDGCHIPAGDVGVLLRDEQLYRERFAQFNTHFYRRVSAGQDYPLDYANQAQLFDRPEDHILFVGLNSCWDIDHHFRERASIHMGALTQTLDRFQDGRYDGWLKIGVWHHPVTGQHMMNDEFLQLLAVHGFEGNHHTLPIVRTSPNA